MDKENNHGTLLQLYGYEKVIEENNKRMNDSMKESQK
jgi:hypothetical protein